MGQQTKASTYVIYVDPDTNLPLMRFFKIAAPGNSQDAPDLKEAIMSTFSRHDLDSALKKMILVVWWNIGK